MIMDVISLQSNELVSAERDTFGVHTSSCDDTDLETISCVDVSLCCRTEDILNQSHCLLQRQWLFLHTCLVLQSYLQSGY